MEQLTQALNILQGLATPLLAYILYVAKDIRQQLRILNGRTKTLEQWVRDHEKSSDAKEAATTRELDRLTRQAEQH